MSNPADSKAPETGASPAPQLRPISSWLVLAIALFGVLAGAAVVVTLKSSVLNETPVAATSAATPVQPPAASASAASPAARATVTPRVPKWTGGVRRTRGRNLAVYELDSENEVPVWGKVVRPLLTVRCVSGTTEVFVLTQSAAALEGSDGRHTVRVGFDGGADASERWLASADYDALFAENGIAAARRIVGARTMRFGFTPFNGAPVVARFDVAGFEEIASKLAQTCRW